jgi:hypothetical protein
MKGTFTFNEGDVHFQVPEGERPLQNLKVNVPFNS